MHHDHLAQTPRSQGPVRHLISCRVPTHQESLLAWADSEQCDLGIAPLTEAELEAARHLFPNMTMGIPENHGKEGYAGEFIDGWLHGLAPRPYPGGPLDNTPLQHIRSARPFSMNGPLPAGLHIPLPNGRGWIRAKLNASHVDLGEPIESSESQGDGRPVDAIRADGAVFGKISGEEGQHDSRHDRAVSFLESGLGHRGQRDGGKQQLHLAADVVQVQTGHEQADRGNANAGDATARSETATDGSERGEDAAARQSGGDWSGVGWMDARTAHTLAKKLGY